MKIRSERDLGHALRAMRHRANLSQRELASRAALRQASISIVENPDSSPHGTTLATLFSLLTALDLELELRHRGEGSSDRIEGATDKTIGFDPDKY